MYTLGDQRSTLGCWGDDLLVEADDVDLDAVEAHLKRLAVKVLARVGGKHSGEAGFLKRVLRYDAVIGSFSSGAVGSATCKMPPPLFSSQGGTTSARQRTLLARRALVRLCETETRSSMETTQPPSGAHWDQ